jgi:hypothetical protein
VTGSPWVFPTSAPVPDLATTSQRTVTGLSADALTDPGLFDGGYDRATLGCALLLALGGLLSAPHRCTPTLEPSRPRTVQGLDVSHRPCQSQDVIDVR